MHDDKFLGDTARVVVLGDPGVGKSSLIAAATDSFDPNPPPCLPPTRLPPQIENIPLLVVDTSTRSENQQSLDSLVEGADVIILCYSVDVQDSMRSLRMKWLPDLRKLPHTLPIVLCGCKMDKEPDQFALDLQRAQLTELLKEYREIETAIECSAQTLNMVQEAFHFAVKAVVHPQYQLYDALNQRIRPKCAQALHRIFLLCDLDNDKRLNEDEINAFQIKCFKSPLQPDELDSVLNTVYQKLPQGTVDNCLTLQGFIFVQALFMERGCFEITWAVLRTFGYTNDLNLTDDLLVGINLESMGDQVVYCQLSDKAIAFLMDWFKSLDEDERMVVKDSVIISQMEATASEKIWETREWKDVLVSTSHPGQVTLEGFLGKWKYCMLVDPKSTLKQLLYLGWRNGPASDLCTISRRRKGDKRDPSSRSIIQCMVFGGKGSGKTSLLHALIGYSPSEDTQETDFKGDRVAVDTVSMPPSIEKTLVLKEMGLEATSKLLEQAEDGMNLEEVDVAAFLFDSSDPASFHEAQKLMLQVSALADTLPCVLIATKKDLIMSKELTDDINKVCAELRMQQPIQVSTKNGELNLVFRSLVKSALMSGANDIPETPARKAAKARRKWTQRLLIVGSLSLAIGVGTLCILPLYRDTKESRKRTNSNRVS